MKLNLRGLRGCAVWLFAALSCVGVPAIAATYKCVGPGGKTAYQSYPCPSASTSTTIDVSPSVQDGAASSKDAWTFWRRVDQVTGAVTCGAVSPGFDLTTPSGRWINAQLLHDMNSDGETIYLRVQSGEVFHHAFAGSMLKVGDVAYPFMSRPVQRAMHVGKIHVERVSERLAAAAPMMVRVKLWPWDEFVDSRVAQFSGYRQARALAKECSKRN